MKRLTMTVAAIALTAGTAYAQSETDDTKMLKDDATAQSTEGTMEMDTDTTAATDEAAPMTEGDTDMAAEETAPMTEGDTDMTADGTAPMTEGSDMAVADPAMDTGPVIAGLEAGDMLSSDLEGGDVLAMATQGDGEMMNDTDSAAVGDMSDGETDMDVTDMAETDSTDQWQDVGDISDVVFSSDGQIKGIVADIGGFLGLGEKQVFVPVADYELKTLENDRYAVVVNYTEEQLDAMGDADEEALN